MTTSLDDLDDATLDDLPLDPAEDRLHTEPDDARERRRRAMLDRARAIVQAYFG